MRRKRTATPSAASSRFARAACLRASARTRRKEDRLDARLAAALMGIQAVKGVEIGDGFALAGERGSAAHDEIFRDDRGYYRETNRAGGIEGGVSNGEEIVVRAAMKPLPTLMRPLRSADLETGEPAEALVERSDVAAVEALSVVAEASVAFELARAAREKFGGDAIGDFVAAHRRLPRAHPVVGAVDKHLALIGFMGAGKSTLGRELAQPHAPSVRRHRRGDREALRARSGELFERGEPEFRRIEEQVVAEALAGPTAVIALGGGAVLSEATRSALPRRRHLSSASGRRRTMPGSGCEDSGRPLARDHDSSATSSSERARRLRVCRGRGRGRRRDVAPAGRASTFA